MAVLLQGVPRADIRAMLLIKKHQDTEYPFLDTLRHYWPHTLAEVRCQAARAPRFPNCRSFVAAGSEFTPACSVEMNRGETSIITEE